MHFWQLQSFPSERKRKKKKKANQLIFLKKFNGKIIFK